MMIFSNTRSTGLAFGLACVAAFGSVTPAKAHDPNEGREKLVFASKLPNVPGQSLTAVIVTYAPGGSTPRHRHSGSVYAYVLSGAICSENSATGAVQIYRAGESFFEPPGSLHLISENASRMEPASFFAIFVAEDGATLTTINK